MKHNTTGIILIALALLMLGLAFQGQIQAANLFQSPLPPPDTPCFVQTLDGFTLEAFGHVADGDGMTTLTYRVTNANKKDISYIAFGIGSWIPLAPSGGMTTTLSLGDYHIEWTNDRGNPGFASVKYETQFNGFSQGAQDTFALTVGNFDPSVSIQIQMKAGKDRTTFTLTLRDIACDRTPTPTPTATPFSPLPTPTLPADIPDIAVYILQDSDYETPLSAAEKSAIWERGDPIPDTEVALAAAPVVFHHAKAGLAAPIPNLVQQTAAEGWSELYQESFDGAFPQHNQQYGGCHLELLSTKPADYHWGGDNFRTYENSAGAAWPAKGGALGAALVPGSSTYPDGTTTQIICRFSGLNATTLKNVMTEFALWLDEADAGDTFFVGFNTGEPRFFGKRWQKTPLDDQGNPRWERYRFYYPELAEKVTANGGNLAIMWSFTSDGNERGDAQGAWLDDIVVERYLQPMASVGCEDLAQDPSSQMQVPGAPGAGMVSKGLNLPPATEDNTWQLGLDPALIGRMNESAPNWVRLEFVVQPSAFIRLRDQTALAETIDLKHYDRLIDELCANHIAVLGLVTYQSVADTSWRIEGEAGMITASYLNTFTKTLSILLDYYDDRIDAWEIWNEPDFTETRLHPREFARLMLGTAPLIRRANDTVVFGGLANIDRNTETYLNQFYQALRDNFNSPPTPFDIYAFHPYPSYEYQDGNGLAINPQSHWRKERPTTFKKFQDLLAGFNALSRNDSDKDAWVTEFGWNSAQGSDADKEDRCVTLEEQWVSRETQKLYLATGMDILFQETAWEDGRPWVTKAFWYQYRDTGQNFPQTDCTIPVGPLSPSWWTSWFWWLIYGPPPEQAVEVPWSFGLYDGNFMAKEVLCTFQHYPNWRDACYNFDYAVYLPVVNGDQPLSAAGE